MRLQRLTLRRLPGIHREFELTDLSPRLNVIVGPNASGKTSICQAVRRLLWPLKHLPNAFIHSEWVCDRDHFTIELKE